MDRLKELRLADKGIESTEEGGSGRESLHFTALMSGNNVVGKQLFVLQFSWFDRFDHDARFGRENCPMYASMSKRTKRLVDCWLEIEGITQFQPILQKFIQDRVVKGDTTMYTPDSVPVCSRMVVAAGHMGPFRNRVTLARAHPSFHGKRWFSCVGVKGSLDEVWYAKLLVLFSCKRRGQQNLHLAFIRWYEKLHIVDATTCTMLKWAHAPRSNGMPYYDIVEVDSIQSVEHIVPRFFPPNPEYFYVNRFKW